MSDIAYNKDIETVVFDGKTYLDVLEKTTVYLKEKGEFSIAIYDITVKQVGNNDYVAHVYFESLW